MGTKVQKKSLTLANAMPIFDKRASFFSFFKEKETKILRIPNIFYVKKKNFLCNIWYIH